MITGASGFLVLIYHQSITTTRFIASITGLTQNLAVLNKNNYPEITWVEGNILDMPLMLELVGKQYIIIIAEWKSVFY